MRTGENSLDEESLAEKFDSLTESARLYQEAMANFGEGFDLVADQIAGAVAAILESLERETFNEYVCDLQALEDYRRTLEDGGL